MINALPEPHKEVMTLRFYECISVEAIAAKQHTSRQAVYKRIEWAINLMQNTINGTIS
jgi:DNA-directed RNA polymerase specialized sigma24 family protein